MKTKTKMSSGEAALMGAAAAMAALTAWGFLHWFFDGTEKVETERTVTVVDRSEGWTDVQPVLKGWSRSEHVNLELAGACPKNGGYCVVIKRPAGVDRDWLGYWTPVSNTVSVIDLNSSHDLAPEKKARQWIVCHEISHALFGSLDKVVDSRNDACSVDIFPGPGTPTRRDLDMLDRVQEAGTAQRDTALAW